MSDITLSQFFDQLGIVRITSGVTTEQKHKKDSGEVYDVRSQRAVYLYTLDGQLCSQPVEYRLGRNDTGYSPGDYMISGPAFGRGQWGNLQAERYQMPLIRIPDGLVRLLEQDRERARKAA